MGSGIKQANDIKQTTEAPDAYEAEERRARPWWAPWLAALVVAAVVIGVGSWLVYGRDAGVASMGMGGDHAPPPSSATTPARRSTSSTPRRPIPRSPPC